MLNNKDTENMNFYKIIRNSFHSILFHLFVCVSVSFWSVYLNEHLEFSFHCSNTNNCFPFFLVVVAAAAVNGIFKLNWFEFNEIDIWIAKVCRMTRMMMMMMMLVHIAHSRSQFETIVWNSIQFFLVILFACSCSMCRQYQSKRIFNRKNKQFSTTEQIVFCFTNTCNSISI